jgi:hypothetical protein
VSAILEKAPPPPPNNQVLVEVPSYAMSGALSSALRLAARTAADFLGKCRRSIGLNRGEPFFGDTAKGGASGAAGGQRGPWRLHYVLKKTVRWH